MNSRIRRKLEAQEFNERKALIDELSSLRAKIYEKHKTWIHVIYDNGNDSVRGEIKRLCGILSSDAAPPRKVGLIGSGKTNKAYIAAMMALALSGGM